MGVPVVGPTVGEPLVFEGEADVEDCEGDADVDDCAGDADVDGLSTAVHTYDVPFTTRVAIFGCVWLYGLSTTKIDTL